MQAKLNVIFSGKYLRQIRVNEPVAYSFSDSDISEEEDKDDQRKKIDEAKIDINVVQHNALNGDQNCKPKKARKM